MMREEKSKSNQGRCDYLQGLLGLLERRRDECDRIRQAYLSPETLKREPAKYRKDLCAMLGWPLTEQKPNTPVRCVARETIAEEDGLRFERLRLQISADLLLPALLITPDDGKPSHRPVLFQHGGHGTPELCCDFHGDNNYRHVPRRIAQKGAAVLAPQLLLWNQEAIDRPAFPGYGCPYNRVTLDTGLKQAGSSIAAVEIFALMCTMDWMEQQPEFLTDQGFAMAGLSYGGFYSLYAAAVDQRINAVYSSCFFNNSYRYDWADLCWANAAKMFLHAEVAALIAPRALYIEVGSNDPVFAIDSACAEAERLKPFYAAQGAEDRFVFHVLDDGHKMDLKDTGIDFILG